MSPLCGCQRYALFCVDSNSYSDDTICLCQMGIPPSAVQQALQKDGKDPNIIDMDPEQSYASQTEGKTGGNKMTTGLPLKDDPEFRKFFKVCIAPCYYFNYTL